MPRIWDVTFAAAALVLCLPLLLLIAATIKLTSRGPVFYRDRRRGLGDCSFDVLKFRSMTADPSRVMAPSLVEASQASGVLVKMQNDPRTTAVGRFLRRSSLDELPQFVNVLRGEMSVVGPRPLPDFMLQAGRPGHLRKRAQVRPGITGLWQVSARHRNTRLADMLAFDLYYVRHRSAWLDARILAATIPAVLKQTGAM